MLLLWQPLWQVVHCKSKLPPDSLPIHSSSSATLKLDCTKQNLFRETIYGPQLSIVVDIVPTGIRLSFIHECVFFCCQFFPISPCFLLFCPPSPFLSNILQSSHFVARYTRSLQPHPFQSIPHPLSVAQTPPSPA